MTRERSLPRRALLAGAAATAGAAAIYHENSAIAAGGSDASGATPSETAAGIVPVDYRYPPGNVCRYGAIGNGTTDNTAAFQRACHAGVGEVTIPYASYVAGSIHVPSNTLIRGLGEPIIKQRANDEQIFDLSNSVNVEVTGIKFDGNGMGKTLSTYTNCAVMSKDTSDGIVKNCSVHHCRLVGFHSWAVSFAGNAGGPNGYSYNVWIHHNLIENQFDEGISLYYMKQSEVTDNVIRAHAKEGIKVVTSDNVTVARNRIYALATGPTDGPLINVGTDCNEIAVLDNDTYKGNKGIGVEKRVHGVRILGNHCEGTLEEGIGVAGTARDTSPVCRIIISANITKDTGQHGINVSGIVGQEAYAVSITGNNIYNAGAHTAAGGIHVYHFVDAMVSDNVVHTGAKEGIVVSIGTVAVVGHNYVNNVSQHGIRITGVTDSNVSSNAVYDANRAASTFDAINVDSACTNSMVENNICKALSGDIHKGVVDQATNPHVGFNIVIGTG